MAEIDTAAVLSAVTLALHKAFPAARVYVDEVEQGLKKGDFIALLVLDRQAREGKNLTRRFPLLDVLYFPKGGRSECSRMGDTLFSLLECVPLAGGGAVRGTGMTAEVEDDVLHFRVSYRYGQWRQGSAPAMEEFTMKQGG